jgi:LuxR family transcriptional regulator, regulator of acetate metabolism
LSSSVSTECLEPLRRLHQLRRRLAAATSVGGLFADAAALASEEFGFERALVLSVEQGGLSARTSDALDCEASDRLRRQLLAEPMRLRSDSLEAELIRQGRLPSGSRGESQLAAALNLHEFVLAPIAPEARTLAILLVERSDRPISELDELTVTLFADCTAAALERVVVRARQAELACDIQQLAASTMALMREVVQSPVALPDDRGAWPAFPLSASIGPGSQDGLQELLTDGERRIAALLVQGRSNREIADELIFSPETVKATVAKILRKLGAANRVEAAATILRLTASGN